MQRIHILLCILLLLTAMTVMPSYACASQEYHVTVEGRERTYWQYRPALLHSGASPLVIVLHGGFGSGQQAEKSYAWDELADRDAFVVAYPDGVDRSWNAGGICCGAAMRTKVDDLGFITALIHDVEQREAIDPHRIYITGISNGAALAYHYACEGSEPIAAIGAVAGSLSTSCASPHPVSVMEIHGMDDRNIPMEGGRGTHGVTKVSWMPVQQTIDTFRQADRCQAPFSRQEGAITTVTSTCSQNREVVLITIEGAGHQWPGSRSKGRLARLILPIDPPSNALDATTTLWAFFQRQAVP